jgi:hypothetical protein
MPVFTGMTDGARRIAKCMCLGAIDGSPLSLTVATLTPVRKVLTQSVETMIDPITAPVEAALDAVAFAVEMMFDPIAASIQMRFDAVASTVQAIR